MLKVKGRGDYMLIAEVIKKIMGITCVLVLINFDLKLVVIGWTCCSIVEFLISEGFFETVPILAFNYYKDVSGNSGGYFCAVFRIIYSHNSSV